MMKNFSIPFREENGFVLVIAMVILVLVSVIGIAITRTSLIELHIAGNDKRVKHAFYKADGGTEAGLELLEQNFSCATGFQAPTGFDNDDASNASFFSIGGVDIFDAKFARNDLITDVAGATAGIEIDDIPRDGIRSLRIPDDPANRVDTDQHTNLAVYGKTEYSEGSAIQMAAGDKGKGYGAAGGGGIKDMNLIAQYEGAAKTVSKIHLDYAHLIGDEGECTY